jgi:hypothetical protein
VNILVGDFSAKVSRKEMFRQTTGNDSFHEINDGKGVRVINFATFKTLPKVQRFNIVTFISLFQSFLKERLTIR